MHRKTHTQKHRHTHRRLTIHSVDIPVETGRVDRMAQCFMGAHFDGRIERDSSFFFVLFSSLKLRFNIKTYLLQNEHIIVMQVKSTE